MSLLFNDQFYDFSDLWRSNVTDTELVSSYEKMDIYSPIVEDISLEDEVLCKAVEDIEYE